MAFSTAGHILFLAIAATAIPVAARPAQTAIPPAVRALIDRRTGCAHWSGEDPYDPARTRQIERAMRNLGCETLDADQRRLQIHYRRDPRILRLLAAD